MYYQSNESGKTVLIGPDDDDMDNSGADLDASHYLGLSANTLVFCRYLKAVLILTPSNRLVNSYLSTFIKL